MKKIVYFMMFLIIASLSYATIDAFPECVKKSCVEGSMMNWTVSVSNNINKTITVSEISIYDADTADRIAFYDSEGNVTLSSDESKVYKFQQLITAPSNGYTFTYRPCFKVSVEDGDSGIVCKDALKSLTVLPLDKTECKIGDDCATNEYCDTTYTLKCKALECNESMAIRNHECVEKLNISMIKPVYFVLLGVVLLAIVGVIAFTLALKPEPKKKKSKKKR